MAKAKEIVIPTSLDSFPRDEVNGWLKANLTVLANFFKTKDKPRSK